MLKFLLVLTKKKSVFLLKKLDLEFSNLCAVSIIVVKVVVNSVNIMYNTDYT